MAPIVNAWAGWCRRNLAWSHSRESWEERLALVLLLAGAGGLGWFGGRVSSTVRLTLGGLLLLALAALLRRGWLRLFGPVLFYDLLRTARRSRYVLVRCAYACLLLFLLFSTYLSHAGTSWEVPADRMADAAESFFTTFMYVQFVAVALLTPAYTAGAIADEKDRRTLEFLLATDLRNREIVLGKLVSRLANLTLILLTGLPVLSLLQLLGGIDPDLLLAGFAFTGLTAASLGALSILNSVYARKPRDAIVLTYLTAGAYLGLSLLSLLLLYWPDVASLPLTWGAQPFTVADLVQAFNAGNLVFVMNALDSAWRSGQPLDDVVAALLRNYALFHGLLAVGCAAWAVAQLRAVAIRQASGPGRMRSLVWRLRRRSPLGRDAQPMVWKEMHAEAGLRLNWMGRIVLAVLVVTSFAPAVWIVIEYADNPAGRWVGAGDAMNLWVRPVGTIVACLMLLSVAVRASSSVGTERDRQTLDALLTTPLETDAILYGKWIGSILSVRRAWLWLGLIWVVGLVTGGLNIFAIPFLIVAWGIYACFLASLGLWFSVVSKTTLRATVWTLLTTGAVAMGHWLIWMCCGPLLAYRGGGEGWRFVFIFQAFGLTPPLTMGLLAFGGDDLRHATIESDIFGELLASLILGLGFWVGAASVFWTKTCSRFEHLTGRGADSSLHPRIPDRKMNY